MGLCVCSGNISISVRLSLVLSEVVCPFQPCQALETSGRDAGNEFEGPSSSRHLESINIDVCQSNTPIDFDRHLHLVFQSLNGGLQLPLPHLSSIHHHAIIAVVIFFIFSYQRATYCNLA